MAKTTIVSRASRCQPNLAPHFNFYHNNTRILPLWRRSPGGMLVADFSSRAGVRSPGASLPLFIHFALYEQLRNAVCVITRKSGGARLLAPSLAGKLYPFPKTRPRSGVGTQLLRTRAP